MELDLFVGFDDSPEPVTIVVTARLIWQYYVGLEWKQIFETGAAERLEKKIL